MKINEVEQAVGISKKNIRFYEDRGLLHPDRNSANGYRDYSEDDVTVLMKIKLLRRLSIPIEEIRRILENKLSLSDCLDRHQIYLNHELANISHLKELCETMAKESLSFEAMDPSAFLTQLDELEKGGHRFMDVKKTDVGRKKRGAGIAAIFMVIVMLGYDALMLGLGVSGEMPIGMLLIMVIPPTAVVVGVLLALKERLKEIDKGEDNEALKY